MKKRLMNGKVILETGSDGNKKDILEHGGYRPMRSVYGDPCLIARTVKREKL